MTPDTLRTLDREATPGPWVASDQHSDAVNGRHWRIESDATGYPNDGWVIASEVPGPDGEANARLIAYVRTHLPEIIAHLTMVALPHPPAGEGGRG